MMIDLDQWQEIFSTMRRNWLRTLLTAIGVFWGVFMLMVMVGFGNGLETGVKKDMAGIATNSFYVWGGRTSVPFDGLAPGKFVELTVSDAQQVQAAVPEIRALAPRASLGGRGGGTTVSRKEKSASFQISGDVPALRLVQPMTMINGRFLNELDQERHRKVAVIGENVLGTLFAVGEDPIGETLEVRGVEFLVVGVFRSPATGDRADRLANTIHLPLSTFQTALRPSPVVNNFAVLVHEGESAELAMIKVQEELRRIHRIAPTDIQAIGTWNAEKEFQKINGLFFGIRALIAFVGAMTLLAGILGVSNIMMISVRERTREIGIRRAIGATPWAILAQILKESTVLTALAGTLGLMSGVGLLELVGAFLKQGTPGEPSLLDPPHAQFSVAVLASVVLVAGGAGAGLIPALQALRVRPVVALRDE